MTRLARGLVLFRKIVLHRLFWYTLTWILALAVAGSYLYSGWNAFNDSGRPDGNSGHCQIDFGGQYLMGRMLVTGNGLELFNRRVQRTVLEEAYPNDANLESDKTDAAQLFGWMMQANSEQEARWVGGPLYPPINAFFFAPLAVFPPQVGYRINQIANVVLVFIAALGISVTTRRGVWWPMAAFLLFLFPGTNGSITLGQNAVLTLTVAVWGWALAARGRPGWAGVVWGLLAFKPVWALALFLVPLLSRRWLMCATMIATGVVLAAATYPFVGLDSWLNWLKVGKIAAEWYNTDHNWIFLSRDLLGIPRRWLLDFSNSGHGTLVDLRAPANEGWGVVWHTLFGDQPIPGWLLPALSGWLIVGLVLEVTVRTALLRWRDVQTPVGPPAAFLFLGAWMCCYHFMYYDVLIAALPVLLLFHDSAEYLRPIFLVVSLRPWVLRAGRGALSDTELVSYYGPRLVTGLSPTESLKPLGFRNVWVFNRLVPILVPLIIATQHGFMYLGLGSYAGPPWDTYFLMGLWLWCFVLWMQTPNQPETTPSGP